MSSNENILIIEDMKSLASTYSNYLGEESYNVFVATSITSTYKLINQHVFNVIIIDINSTEFNGLDFLDELMVRNNPAQPIIITSEDSTTLAVKSIRKGAFDFIVKPFSKEKLITTVRNASDKYIANMKLAKSFELTTKSGRHGFIGDSLSIQSIYNIIDCASKSEANVLIQGQIGTGIHIAASAIHSSSIRNSKSFVVFDCLSIPVADQDYSLFGSTDLSQHIKENLDDCPITRATGGTLVIDEISELSSYMQIKLLRFIQNKQSIKKCTDEYLYNNIRFICTTSKDLLSATRAGYFNLELYYCINVIPILMPSLVDRSYDIAWLSMYFIEKYSKLENKKFKGLSDEALTILMSYDWPGNVKELENILHHIIIINDHEYISTQMIPQYISQHSFDQGLINHDDSNPNIEARHVISNLSEGQPKINIQSLDVEIEMIIHKAIGICEGSIPRAALALGVSPSTLYRRLQAKKL